MAGVFEKWRNWHWEIRASMTFMSPGEMNEYNCNVDGMPH